MADHSHSPAAYALARSYVDGVFEEMVNDESGLICHHTIIAAFLGLAAEGCVAAQISEDEIARAIRAAMETARKKLAAHQQHG